MPGKKDRLSILIPTYNRLSLFKDTMASILGQTTKEALIHIAIVDDGSEEGNYEYALGLSQSYPFIEVVKHEKNLGVGAARNTLLGMAKGQYLLFLASDDILLEGALKAILELIVAGETKVYVLNTYREKGQKLKFKAFPEDKKGLSLLKSYLDGDFSEALYLVETDFARKFPFHPQLRVREDLRGKVSYLLFGEPRIINRPFAIIRDHQQRLRKVSSLYLTQAVNAIEDLFANLSEEYQSLKPYALAKTYFELAKRMDKMGELTEAKAFLSQAVGYYPQLKKGWQYFKLKGRLFFKGLFSLDCGCSEK